MTEIAYDIESDTTWVSRLHSGDVQVFQGLHTKYARDLYAFLASRCPKGTSAEDLGQTIWLKVWNRRTDFQGGNFRAWIYQIARHMLIDFSRRKTREVQAEEIEPLAVASHDPESENDWLDALRDCLQQIEGTFVEIVRGKTQGLTTEQLAEKYNINVKTVATRIHRGKELLRECVARKVQ